MKIYTPPLDMDCLFEDGTTAEAQSQFLRLNGEAFKNEGRKYPYDRTNKIAEREEQILKNYYGIQLKRAGFRTLKELIKVGQGLEKERIARLSIRASGRKSQPIKTEEATGGSQRLDDEIGQPIPAPTQAPQSNATQPVQPSLTLTQRPGDAHASHDRPRISTMVKDLIVGDHALKSVLMLYVKSAGIAEMKRALEQVSGDWRSIDIPPDCRAALDWVDAH